MVFKIKERSHISLLEIRRGFEHGVPNPQDYKDSNDAYEDAINWLALDEQPVGSAAEITIKLIIEKKEE